MAALSASSALAVARCTPRASSLSSFSPLRSLVKTPRFAFRVRADASGDAEPAVEIAPAAAGSAEAPPKKKIIRRVKKPEGESAADDLLAPGRSVVERGVTVEGVAKVDRGESTSTLTRALLTAAGDAAVLILFAYIGRATHVSAAIDWELIKTASPFLAGWFISAIIFNDYSVGKPLPGSPGEAAGSAVKTWALGVPLGVAFRSLIKGQPPQLPFLVVSIVMTAVFMLGWRAALAAALPGDGGEKSQLDRKGSVFELFELLTSLVRRW
ncbi:hypothetical protein CLOM_g2781 [Closterium sp. NIES-68]|nr:hypothetical protein CLOM_g2781 [Closterium sp. NIES-68]